MNQPLVENAQDKLHDKAAESFLQMSERIKHNRDQPFGGAVVIYPPDGDPIEFLLLDGSADVVQFWATAKKRIENALEDLESRARGQQGFSFR